MLFPNANAKPHGKASLPTTTCGLLWREKKHGGRKQPFRLTAHYILGYIKNRNMPWDSVEVGLAGGEETVNFGPRNESGSSLYQVDTLASVSPRGEVSF